MHPLSRYLSRLGGGSFYLLCGFLLAILEAENGIRFLLSGLFVYSLELPLYLVLKNTIKRDRPCDRFVEIIPSITPSDKFSLPSGHAAGAFVFATLLSDFYPDLGFLAYGIASCVALSRVLLAVHYPSDIIAGALLGLGCTMVGLDILTIAGF